MLVCSGTSYLKLFSLKIFLIFNEFSKFHWDPGRKSGEVWQTLLTVVERNARMVSVKLNVS